MGILCNYCQWHWPLGHFFSVSVLVHTHVRKGRLVVHVEWSCGSEQPAGFRFSDLTLIYCSTCMYFFTVFREIWAREEVSKWSSARIFIWQVLGSEEVLYGRDAQRRGWSLPTCPSKGMNLWRVAFLPATACFVGALNICQTQCALLWQWADTKVCYAAL